MDRENINMNEKYVTNLEISKRLKGLGVKQESEFYWIRYHGNTKYELISKKDTQFYILMSGLDECERYSAYTVGELGEMLPVDYVSVRRGNSWGIHNIKTNKKYFCFWESDNTLFDEQMWYEANARGKMLIYLLENKLI